MSADWNLSDTIRDRIFKRLGLPIGVAREIVLLAMQMHPQSDDYWVVKLNGDEGDTLLTKIKITAGAVGTDTDADGLIWGTCTDESPGAGQATVSLYKDSGRSTKVSEGSAADGASLTLAAGSGYTLAGTLTLGTISATFNFVLLLVQPFYKRLDDLFNGDEEDDAQNKNAVQDALDTARTQMLAAAQTLAAGAGQIMRTTFRRRLVSRSSESVLIDPGLEQSGTGQVSEKPSGLQEDLRLAMAANSGGSGEMKAGAATQSSSSSAASGTNVTITGPTLGKRAVPMVLTFRCVKTLDASGPPEFEALADPTDTRRKPEDGQQSIPASFPLRMGKTWKDPELGIESLVVDYTASAANSSSAALSTTAGDWSVEGMTSENSDSGKLWTYYDLASTTLEFYKSEDGRDSRDADELVTQVVTSSTATVLTTEDTGTGLVVTGKTGATLGDGAKGYVDFQPPVATQPASRFTITISQTVDPSVWTEVVRDAFIGGAPGQPRATQQGWELNTGSIPNIDDSWIQGGMPLGHLKLFRRRV